MKEESKKTESGHGLYRADMDLFRYGTQILRKQASFTDTFLLKCNPILLRRNSGRRANKMQARIINSHCSTEQDIHERQETLGTYYPGPTLRT